MTYQLTNQLTKNPHNPLYGLSYEQVRVLLKDEPSLISYFRPQPKELCELAVRINGHALVFVREQTEELCKVAVQQNGFALCHVHKQTEEICRLAVEESEAAIEYVSDEFIHLFQ